MTTFLKLIYVLSYKYGNALNNYEIQFEIIRRKFSYYSALRELEKKFTQPSNLTQYAPGPSASITLRNRGYVIEVLL